MISIVLGSFMGDEGKGQTVHNICAKNPENSLVIRFSGGHQVGHTVKYGDLMHTFSNFGSGTLLGVPTYWSEYCTVDPNNQFNDFQKSFRAIEFDPVLFRHSLNIDSMFSHNVRKKVIVTHWDEATDKDMFIRPNFELYIYEEYVKES